ncbi:MAG: hypothetical protein CMB99_09065 [Flavobacteriaceae bacterium]|nr:hypothetical protein [Flavobacteriaceae bacterium]|tara:strand:+ start:525887 stop:526594 length:708 start_codon:yes stop_codon:yes gene_type:complete
MKVNEQQIDQLFEFTRKHYVEYYDVQSELVDHLANDIEEIWKEHPNLTFMQARDRAFKKFGIFGFADVIKARESAMTKKYWKLILRFTQEWFSPPKIVFTLGLFFGFFMLFQLPNIEYFILSGLAIGICIEVYNWFMGKKQRQFREQKKEKLFLLEAMIGTTRNGFSGLALINFFNLMNLTSFDFSSFSTEWLVVLSLVMTILVIMFNVCTFVLPNKAQELLEETYPEYKIVKSL